MSAHDRARKAWNGRRVVPRGEKSWIRAARYLEGAGFPEAAEELAKAAREPLAQRAFWTDARAEALARVARLRQMPLTSDEKTDLAGLLLALGQFVAGRGLLVLAEQQKKPTSEQSIHIMRSVAMLAGLLLDLTEPEWRHKLSALRAMDRDE